MSRGEKSESDNSHFTWEMFTNSQRIHLMHQSVQSSQ